MAYNVVSGDIINGQLYYVAGTQSVVYNTSIYTTGQFFRGVPGVRTFTYSGSGTQVVNEIAEIRGASIEYLEVVIDQPIYTEVTTFKGFAVEYELNDSEKAVQETTRLTGFGLEFVDYPFYSFEITETRL